MISTDNSTIDQAHGNSDSCTLGNLKIFYTNCDQFPNKRDDLLMDKPPDIILLVEVIPKAQVASIDQIRLTLPGYNAYFNFDPSLSNLGSLGSRGIAIFINSNINAYQFHDVVSQLWISVPLAGSDLLLVGCVYCSPSSVTSTSTHQLCRLLESVTSLSTHLLVCGDFSY